MRGKKRGKIKGGEEEVENINPWFLSPTEHYESKHGINWDNQARDDIDEQES